MPTYAVHFDQPVIDQPDHPTARRVISVMEVHAPSAEDAKIHAIRTTVGQGQVTHVTEVTRA